MADEQDLERNYPATPRRLEQARERGQVARSRELTTAAVTVAAAIGLSVSGASLFTRCMALVHDGLKLDRAAALDPAQLTSTLQALGTQAAWAILPLLLLTLGATVAGPLLMSGWVFSPQAFAPDFARLDPLRGIANLWSKRALAELAKAVAKCVLLTAISTITLMRAFDSLQSLAMQDPNGAVIQIGRLLETAMFALAGGLALIALVDVPYTLWRHRDALKMTREELRQELRELEGDPHLKARIRSLQRASARKRMLAAVPKASVVVTNPTHYAVALEYRDATMRAPRVVAKGLDLVAQRIKDIAAEHAVPVLEAPALARALYRHAELDAEIPNTLYGVVARVLAYVYQLQSFRARGGAAPAMPTDLDVPPGMDPASA